MKTIRMYEESSFICPFCHQGTVKNDASYREFTISFNSVLTPFGNASETSLHAFPKFKIIYQYCSGCNQVSILAEGFLNSKDRVNPNIYPISSARHFPEYVPQQIRNDYEEAAAIVDLSPKASATLSRRCLQGMIANFWGIKENNLAQAIKQLQSKVDVLTWETIDSIRKIGNIGAHMERDVNLIIDIDPDEATQLLRFIEFLIDSWYVERHKREELMRSINQVSEVKQALRKGR